MESTGRRVTELVRRLGDGDAAVAEGLLPLVYEQLRSVAKAMFVRQPGGHTLQPTALVHEAWLKLAGGAKALEGRSHSSRSRRARCARSSPTMREPGGPTDAARGGTESPSTTS